MSHQASPAHTLVCNGGRCAFGEPIFSLCPFAHLWCPLTMVSLYLVSLLSHLSWILNVVLFILYMTSTGSWSCQKEKKISDSSSCEMKSRYNIKYPPNWVTTIFPSFSLLSILPSVRFAHPQPHLSIYLFIKDILMKWLLYVRNNGLDMKSSVKGLVPSTAICRDGLWRSEWINSLMGSQLVRPLVVMEM